MRTQDAKNIHCKDYLEKIGARFARSQYGTHGLEFVYHSPIRKDEKPSLCVNIERNIWSDVPVGEGGRLIELVCYINGLVYSQVSEALGILDDIYSGRASYSLYTPNISSRSTNPSRSPHNLGYSNCYAHDEDFSNFTSYKEKEGRLQLVAEKEIYYYPLKNYLLERKIPLELAKIYLKEIVYKDGKGREFFALGWRCGATYGLRSKTFKGFIGKGISIRVFDMGTPEIYVFEGMFDYLSYLSHKKRKKPPITTIVMNSITMLPKLDTWLQLSTHVRRINCYFDNDDAGRQCFSKLKEMYPDREIYDYSKIYSCFKDYADWYVSR